MEGGPTLKGRWIWPPVYWLFLSSPISQLRFKKSQIPEFLSRHGGERTQEQSSFYDQRARKGGPMKKESEENLLFFLSFSVLSQTNVPELYSHEGSSSHKSTWNREENSLFWLEEWKSKRESWLLFCGLFPVAASPQSQSQSQEMHSSDGRLESHLSSLRPNTREPKGLGSVGGVVKRMESWEMGHKKMCMKFYTHLSTVHMQIWPQTALRQLWGMN